MAFIGKKTRGLGDPGKAQTILHERYDALDGVEGLLFRPTILRAQSHHHCRRLASNGFVWTYDDALVKVVNFVFIKITSGWIASCPMLYLLWNFWGTTFNLNFKYAFFVGRWKQ